MTTTSRTRRGPIAACTAMLVLVALLSASGCGARNGESAASDSGATTGAQSQTGNPVAPEQRAPGANQAAGDASKVTPLPADRRAELPSGFPIEVPVPGGSVTRAEAQGDSAWVYELSLEAQPFDVAAWYRAAYASANWQLVRDQVAESGGTLIFVKGEGAQSKIRLTAEPGGTKVTASVGVGEAVGETF